VSECACDGVADTDENDDNNDLVPDELPMEVRKAWISVEKIAEVPQSVIDAVTNFRGYIADHTKAGSRPLQRT
jgi:hypothetical protein